MAGDRTRHAPTGASSSASIPIEGSGDETYDASNMQIALISPQKCSERLRPRTTHPTYFPDADNNKWNHALGFGKTVWNQRDIIDLIDAVKTVEYRLLLSDPSGKFKGRRISAGNKWEQVAELMPDCWMRHSDRFQTICKGKFTELRRNYQAMLRNEAVNKFFTEEVCQKMRDYIEEVPPPYFYSGSDNNTETKLIANSSTEIKLLENGSSDTKLLENGSSDIKLLENGSSGTKLHENGSSEPNLPGNGSSEARLREKGSTETGLVEDCSTKTNLLENGSPGTNVPEQRNTEPKLRRNRRKAKIIEDGSNSRKSRKRKRRNRQKKPVDSKTKSSQTSSSDLEENQPPLLRRSPRIRKPINKIESSSESEEVDEMQEEEVPPKASTPDSRPFRNCRTRAQVKLDREKFMRGKGILEDDDDKQPTGDISADEEEDHVETIPEITISEIFKRNFELLRTNIDFSTEYHLHKHLHVHFNRFEERMTGLIEGVEKKIENLDQKVEAKFESLKWPSN